VRARLFWKLGLTYVAVLIGVLLVFSFYQEGRLRVGLLALCAVLILAGLALSLILSRSFSARIEILKTFSRRIADGDFRPMDLDGPQDELTDLGDALNQTAGRLDREIRLLSGERNRSSAILRSMVEGVAVVDPQERMVFCNRAFSEIFNVDPSSGEGHALIETVRNSELLALIRKALRGEEGLQSEIAMGITQIQYFSVSATPVRAIDPAATAPPKISGAVVVLHDVTELRRLERVRQDFVANVSHEFKTPLTAIQGFPAHHSQPRDAPRAPYRRSAEARSH
jgi:two-component system phosphate regulon sensor histidine kinase PhoR